MKNRLYETLTLLVCLTASASILQAAMVPLGEKNSPKERRNSGFGLRLGLEKNHGENPLFSELPSLDVSRAQISLSPLPEQNQAEKELAAKEKQTQKNRKKKAKQKAKKALSASESEGPDRWLASLHPAAQNTIISYLERNYPGDASKQQLELNKVHQNKNNQKTHNIASDYCFAQEAYNADPSPGNLHILLTKKKKLDVLSKASEHSPKKLDQKPTEIDSNNSELEWLASLHPSVAREVVGKIEQKHPNKTPVDLTIRQQAFKECFKNQASYFNDLSACTFAKEAYEKNQSPQNQAIWVAAKNKLQMSRTKTVPETKPQQSALPTEEENAATEKWIKSLRPIYIPQSKAPQSKAPQSEAPQSEAPQSKDLIQTTGMPQSFHASPPLPKSQIASQCFACDKSAKNLKTCSRCSTVYYCSRKCQTSNWKTHKQTCSPATKKKQQESTSKEQLSILASKSTVLPDQELLSKPSAEISLPPEIEGALCALQKKATNISISFLGKNVTPPDLYSPENRESLALFLRDKRQKDENGNPEHLLITADRWIFEELIPRIHGKLGATAQNNVSRHLLKQIKSHAQHTQSSTPIAEPAQGELKKAETLARQALKEAENKTNEENVRALIAMLEEYKTTKSPHSRHLLPALAAKTELFGAYTNLQPQIDRALEEIAQRPSNKARSKLPGFEKLIDQKTKKSKPHKGKGGGNKQIKQRSSAAPQARKNQGPMSTASRLTNARNSQQPALELKPVPPMSLAERLLWNSSGVAPQLQPPAPVSDLLPAIAQPTSSDLRQPSESVEEEAKVAAPPALDAPAMEKLVVMPHGNLSLLFNQFHAASHHKPDDPRYAKLPAKYKWPNGYYKDPINGKTMFRSDWSKENLFRRTMIGLGESIVYSQGKRKVSVGTFPLFSGDDPRFSYPFKAIEDEGTVLTLFGLTDKEYTKELEKAQKNNADKFQILAPKSELLPTSHLQPYENQPIPHSEPKEQVLDGQKNKSSQEKAIERHLKKLLQNEPLQEELEESESSEEENDRQDRLLREVNQQRQELLQEEHKQQ